MAAARRSPASSGSCTQGSAAGRVGRLRWTSSGSIWHTIWRSWGAQCTTRGSRQPTPRDEPRHGALDRGPVPGAGTERAGALQGRSCGWSAGRAPDRGRGAPRSRQSAHPAEIAQVAAVRRDRATWADRGRHRATSADAPWRAPRPRRLGGPSSAAAARGRVRARWPRGRHRALQGAGCPLLGQVGQGRPAATPEAPVGRRGPCPEAGARCGLAIPRTGPHRHGRGDGSDRARAPCSWLSRSCAVAQARGGQGARRGRHRGRRPLAARPATSRGRHPRPVPASVARARPGRARATARRAASGRPGHGSAGSGTSARRRSRRRRSAYAASPPAARSRGSAGSSGGARRAAWRRARAGSPPRSRCPRPSSAPRGPSCAAPGTRWPSAAERRTARRPRPAHPPGASSAPRRGSGWRACGTHRPGYAGCTRPAAAARASHGLPCPVPRIYRNRRAIRCIPAVPEHGRVRPTDAQRR